MPWCTHWPCLTTVAPPQDVSGASHQVEVDVYEKLPHMLANSDDCAYELNGYKVV